MNAWELKMIILKSDQEVVMKALHVHVKRKRDGDVIPRISSVGQSAANGVVEKAIQEVEAKLRTMLLALEWRLGHRIPFAPHYFLAC